MKKRILSLAAGLALSWNIQAQPEGASQTPPPNPHSYGNSGWTPDMAYGDSGPGDRGRTAARRAAEQRELARQQEERRHRERLALERQRDHLHRVERERERARFDVQERERLLERERLIARERDRERELGRDRGRRWDSHPGSRSRSRDRDGDGVANRMDRAPNDPRFY